MGVYNGLDKKSECVGGDHLVACFAQRGIPLSQEQQDYARTAFDTATTAVVDAHFKARFGDDIKEPRLL